MDNKQVLADLRNTLAKIYHDPVSVRRIVHDAGLESERIDFNGPSVNNWHNVLLQAQKMDKLDALLSVVSSEYGNNAEIKETISAYRRFRHQQDNIFTPFSFVPTEITPPSTTTDLDNKITENSIVGLLVKQKFDKETNAYWMLLGAIAVNLLFVTFGFIQFNLYPLLFFIILIGLLYINQSVLRYRLAKGYYGTNEYEVREIIQFILDHSDKTDFTDSNGLKKLLPDVEVTTQKVFVKGAVYQ